jgi:hypothetical protein
MSNDAKTVTVDAIRSIVTRAKIPIHVTIDRAISDSLGIDTRDVFKMIPRFSYFDSLASNLLRNNECDFAFYYHGVRCDDRYPVGVIYDILNPIEIPWSLTLKRLTGKRKKSEQIHMNAFKYAEYLETGNIARINHLSKVQCLALQRDITSERFDCEHTFIKNRRVSALAVRIHFSDGISFVRKMPLDAPIYGIVQGILISNVRVGDIVYLKQVDGWLHISIPTAVPDISDFVQTRKVTVTFRAVASTPMIVHNVIKLSIGETIGICAEYIRQNLQLRNNDQDSNNIYLYVEGMFLADEQEPLYNLCLDDSDQMTLYYSLKEAWN